MSQCTCSVCGVSCDCGDTVCARCDCQDMRWEERPEQLRLATTEPELAGQSNQNPIL